MTVIDGPLFLILADNLVKTWQRIINQVGWLSLFIHIEIKWSAADQYTFLNKGSIMTFLIFGFMDNLVLIVSMYYSYLSIEFYIEKYFDDFKADRLVLACISAGFGNTFSDGIGFLVTGNFYYMTLTMIGCLVGMLIIPIMHCRRAQKVA